MNQGGILVLFSDTNKPVIHQYIRPLPVNKILALSELRTLADDKLNVTQNIKFVFHRTENIVEMGENTGCKHLLLFPQCFQKYIFFRVIETGECIVGLPIPTQ